MTPGLGAVATTFMAGVESIRRGHALPIGSLTQMATIRLGKRTENRVAADQGLRAARQPRRPRVRRVGSDSRTTRYTAARKAGVLDARRHRAGGRVSSRASRRCRRHSTTSTSRASTARTSSVARPSANWRSRSGRTFATSRAAHKVDRVVVVWCASTEIYIKPGAAHATIEQFEKAMERNDDAIAPSMLYA